LVDGRPRLRRLLVAAISDVREKERSGIMGAVVAWMKSLGAVGAAGAKFIAALRRKKIELVDENSAPGMPGLVLVSAGGDEIVEEISKCVSVSGGPVLVVALRRSSLGAAGSWRFVQAGASDVFVVEECGESGRGGVRATAADHRRRGTCELLLS